MAAELLPIATLATPLALQGVAMVIDEGWFHRLRGLPRWERLGHPLDTLTMIACIAWLLVTAPATPHALPIYVALAIGSTLFVTKDEGVHAKLCGGGEQWLHSMLFVLHPIVLIALGIAWWQGARGLLIGQLGLASAALAYQVVYWQVVRRPDHAAVATVAPAGSGVAVNNDWYADLGARWYDADDTPIALLRAEARHRNPWIATTIASELGAGGHRVLDLGCGAGFLSNDLAARGHRVTGLDSTAENLAVARARDATGTARYDLGDATALPYPDASFDVVCAMDLLEHVETPAQLVAEASRVLVPGGLLFFHTFNRTWQAKWIVIRGVEAFVANTPAHLHVLRLFLTPAEVRAMCTSSALAITELRGSRPRFRWPLWRMIVTRRVGNDFAFTWTPSLALGYTGYARKLAATRAMVAPQHGEAEATALADEVRA